MAICVPCQPQSLIALRLLTFVANHIGGQDQSKITSNHLTLLENTHNAVTVGSPWWTEKVYRKHTADLEWELKDWCGHPGLMQLILHPSKNVDPVNDVALKILRAFYKLYQEDQTRLFWAMLRCKPEASKTAIERLNAAVYGVTGNLLFDLAEQGDDLGLIQ